MRYRARLSLKGSVRFKQIHLEISVMSTATATKSAAKSTAATKAIEFRLQVADDGQLEGRIYVPAGMVAGISTRSVCLVRKYAFGDDRVYVFTSTLGHYAELIEKFPSSVRAYRIASKQLLEAYTPEPLEELPADFPFPAAPVEEVPAAEPERSAANAEEPEASVQSEAPVPVTEAVDEVPAVTPKSPREMTKTEMLILAENLLPEDIYKAIKRKNKAEILAAIEQVLLPAAA
jgi:hypothetical protein